MRKTIQAAGGAEDDEITVLIERLHDTEKRLARLTAGEVDTVATRDGRAFMLLRSQELLRRSEEEKQNAILNALPAHVALLDAQGEIVSVNTSWRDFSGIHGLKGTNHGVGLNYIGLCVAVCEAGGADASRMETGIRSVLAGGENAFQFEFSCLRSTRKFWYLMTATPLDGSRTSGIVVMYVDISAEKQGHEDLKASELRFRQMADSVGDAFFLRSLDRTQMYYMSPAYETIWGRTCASVYADPLSISDGVHPEDRDWAFPSSPAIRDAEFDVEHRILRPDGELRWVRARGFPVLDDAGKPYRMAGVVTDITDRKRDQEALHDVNVTLEARVRDRTAELRLAMDQADQANRAKSSFLATISHEIRTPMNGVIGMIDVLEQTDLQSSQVEIVKIARESAYALLGIVDDVLDFSKIEAGQFQIDNEPMDVVAQVEGVCDTLIHLAEGQGVTLDLFAHPDIPLRTLGDASRLRQVLLNLTGNAIKFSSDQGRAGHVSVRATLAERKAHTAVIQISVIDNGIGIDDETLSRLFSPFVQADGGTTRRFGGTGLGLSISRRLVELMGGEISVRSKPGKGSTFTVRLPLHALEADRSAVAPMDVPLFDLAGLSCLVLGAPRPLAADLTVYLTHAGAPTRHARDLATAAAWFGRCGSETCVVIVTGPGDAIKGQIDQLRALGRTRPSVDLRLVVIEKGRRRKPRVQEVDLVILDREALHRGEFLRAVALAAGRTEAVTAPERSSVETSQMRLPPVDDCGRSLPILVAEDNVINQKVLQRQLALLGYQVTIVGTGREALSLAMSGDYGLLLADLHMPQMDGYELAVAIRQAEATGEHLPIVALTANALKGEARRCLDIGMDDYMTKPVQLSSLTVMLEKWLKIAPEASLNEVLKSSGGQLAATLPVRAAAADLSVLTAMVGNDPVVISEVLSLFRTVAADLGDQIRRGVASGQMKSAADAAHALKSGARSIGAFRTGELCDEIEATAEGGSDKSMKALMRRFESEMSALHDFLFPAKQS